MASSRSLWLSDIASGAGKVDGIDQGAGDGSDRASHPKAVQEAQDAVDQLIASLAEGEQPGEWVTPLGLRGSRPDTVEHARFESLGSEADGDPPVDSAPVHLIISSKRALTKKYGGLGFDQLDADLRDLKEAIEAGSRYNSGSELRAYTDLEALIVYVDDEGSLTRFGLQPVDAANPWQVKRLVDSVDAQLREQGKEVRYLLIVGGDGIVPFHRLPNPVDDQDSNVPSDNPYASRDAVYLIPDRAVGRMPDGETEGVGFLHTLIRISVEAHRRRSVSKGLLSSMSGVLNRIIHPGSGLNPYEGDRGLGYSASIWRKASRAVFHVIGDDVRLRTCPPLTYEGFQVVEPPHFSYFNLHGIEDGPNWYGQRDVLFPADYPLFPLALRPQDPSINKHANAVVFTEACYGANILGKDECDSIALSLMGVGALAVVGSTKVSYGSIAPPLLGADLMGKHFWEGLQAHLTVGEALQHAKVAMANDMQERQGYLDDEDQKALISFVLYGDPSLPIGQEAGSRYAPGVYATPGVYVTPGVNTTPGVHVTPGQKALVSDELVTSVKSRIETSLPHMSHARVRARPLTVWTSVCEGGSEQFGEHAGRSLRPALGIDGGERHFFTPGVYTTPGVHVTPGQKGLRGEGREWALTLRKEIAVGGGGCDGQGRLGIHAHHQVVKVVVDKSGHILKMVVSR